MSSGPLGRVITRLRHIMAADQDGSLTDRQLLERFTADQEETAFATLVERHGPLVLGLCRRVLHNEHDAEDVFQATFLVLVRKADSIRKLESVGSWLHGVAYRIALKARSQAYRRQSHESAMVHIAEPAEGETKVEWTDLRPVLDEELERLPEKYRAPLLLCYLEGKTYGQAAEQLGWKHGTVCGRLARARELLRGRLERRGVVLSVGLLTALLTGEAAAAVVPAALSATTLKAALLFATGEAAAAGFVSAQAAALTKGVLKTMFLTKLKLTAAFVLAVGLTGAGIGVFTLDKLGAAQPAARPGLASTAPRLDDDKKDEDEATDKEKSIQNLKQIGLGLHTYHDVNGHFPARAAFDNDDKPLLSWRVLILPQIGEEDLYKEFKLDEAWDSAHNKKLLEKMPKIYAPVRGKPKAKYATYYQVFDGAGSIFDGTQATRIADILDGTSNTIMAVEAANAVPWTKPEDIPFNKDKPLPKLVGNQFTKGFHGVMADGSVHLFRKDFDEETLRMAITRNGGEILDFGRIKE
jgi:RNA polymerase sigma factor (sigma-70 family)